MVQNKQKELSRSIAPGVQTRMKPGYEQAYAEKGTGSHRRRVALLEAYLQTASTEMFMQAVTPVVQALPPLRTEVAAIVSALCVVSTLDDISENYGVLWEDTTVRFHIILNARIWNIGKSQSCMVSK